MKDHWRDCTPQELADYIAKRLEPTNWLLLHRGSTLQIDGIGITVDGKPYAFPPENLPDRNRGETV